MSSNLTKYRDYYLEQANNPALPAAERDLWQQLADELTLRLNDDVSAQLTLW